jgi:phosphohistidine phosphatase
MKTIILLRHGKSSWKDDSLADHDRPLKKRGKTDAKKIGSLIKDEDIIPEVIYCSTAKRTRDTVSFMLANLPYDGEVIFCRDLYHGYTYDFIELLNALRNDINCVMIVGHNPGLEEFLSDLTDTIEWLPTAALAWIEVEIESWGNFDEYTEGRLINIWRPREL